MTIKQDFLSACEAFIAETGINATDFGVNADNDRMLMTRLRKGGNITMDKAEAVYAYMADERRKAQRRAKDAARRAAKRAAQ